MTLHWPRGVSIGLLMYVRVSERKELRHMRFGMACFIVAGLIAVAGFLVVHSASSVNAAAMGSARTAGPAAGYALHIDAEQHFGDAHPGEIAHHWCKNLSATLSECQLYDSDRPNARLVGVETIVPTAVWRTFSPEEQKLWHYHRVEIKKVHATLPDVPKDQQAKVMAGLLETYGKIWMLWDPQTSKNPIGQPSVTVLR